MIRAACWCECVFKSSLSFASDTFLIMLFLKHKWKNNVNLRLCTVSVASQTHLTSCGDNYEQSGLLTDTACNLHISVGVEPANQSWAPIAAHAYHLHAAAVAPPRERAKRMERKERKSKNEWYARDRGWFVFCCSTFMSFFHMISEVCAFRDVFFWLL